MEEALECAVSLSFHSLDFVSAVRFTFGSAQPGRFCSLEIEKIHQTDDLLTIKNMVMSTDHHQPSVNQSNLHTYGEFPLPN